MFVAIDNQAKKAVLGTEVDGPAQKDTQGGATARQRFSCLKCGSSLVYDPGQKSSPFDSFLHTQRDEDCLSDGGVAPEHRLGQAVTAKQLYNIATEAFETEPNVDFERRVGDKSQFVISDVRMSEPIRVAVEVLNQNSHISLRRRVKTLFKHGYSVMLVCLTTGRHTPNRIEHHLQKLCPSRVGRFDPETLDLRLGSQITSAILDVDDTDWDAVPNYLQYTHSDF